MSLSGNLTQYVDQVRLELTNIHFQCASLVLRLRACALRQAGSCDSDVWGLGWDET